MSLLFSNTWGIGVQLFQGVTASGFNDDTVDGHKSCMILYTSPLGIVIPPKLFRALGLGFMV